MKNYPKFDKVDEVITYAETHIKEFGKWLLENYNYSELHTMNKLEKFCAFVLFYAENH